VYAWDFVLAKVGSEHQSRRFCISGFSDLYAIFSCSIEAWVLRCFPVVLNENIILRRGILLMLSLQHGSTQRHDISLMDLLQAIPALHHFT
jgi:hypothetical protein